MLCCDNLPHNGKLVRGLVLEFARRGDEALAHWIDRHVTFPSTMVDRIVPATTDADIAENDAVLGLIEQLQAVDTRGVEPMTHPTDMALRLRPDEVTEPDGRERYQQGAPAVEQGLYLVPRVIE